MFLRKFSNVCLLCYSAGVGRSGTLVAIDTLMNVLAAGGDIDVKSVVVRLRMSRTNMVQSMVR